MSARLSHRVYGARLAHLVKARAARRAKNAGAVMFIVAMTVAVLAAVGLYALKAASTEVKTAGFERQNAQTHYLSEYGIIGASQEVSSTKAQLYVGMMVTMPDRNCVSLPGIPPPPPLVAGPLSNACRRMGSSELGKSWATSVLVPYVSAVSPGSLGSVPLSGDYYVELTDPAQVNPPAGYDLKLGLCFTQMTVSATGITQPILAAGNDTAVFGSEGLESARARIIGGPIRCAQ